MKWSNKKQDTGVLIIKYLFIGLFFIAIPFVLDALAGCKVLKCRLNTHFDKTTWFTFWGSYLPGIIIGLITFYNSEQINIQKRRIDELHERYRFRVVKDAMLYQYNKNEDKFGPRPHDEVVSRFRNLNEPMGVDYAEGYLLDFLILDTKEMAIIKNASYEDVEWTIAGRSYGKEYIDSKHCWVNENDKHVNVYWLFNDNENLHESISRCKEEAGSYGSAFSTSIIKVKLNITLIDDSVYSLTIRFNVRLNKDNVEHVVNAINCVAK